MTFKTQHSEPSTRCHKTLRNHPLLCSAIFASCSLLLASPLHADTVTWAVDADGQWTTPANWSSNALPTSTQDVLIDRPAGLFTITLASGNQSINSLTSNENLILSAGNLTIAAPSSTSANLNLFGTTLTGAGNISSTGSLFWDAGTMSGTGTTTAETGSTLTLENGGHTLQRTLINNGNATWTAGNLLLNGNATFTNNGNLSMTSNGISMISQAGNNNIFTNNGTLTKLNNVSTFTVSQAGNTTLTFNNAGTFNIEGGTVVLAIGGSNTGSIFIDSGNTLQFTNTAAFTFAPGSNISGPGFLTFNSSAQSYNFPAGTFNPTGQVNFTSGNITINNDFTPSALSNIGATVNVNATLNLPGTLGITGTGNVTFANPETFNTLNLSAIVGGPGNLTVTNLNLTGGTLAGTGSATVPTGGTITIGSAAAKIARNLLSNGNITWTGVDVDFSANSTLTSTKNLSVNSLSGTINALSLTNSISSFTNNGNFTKSGTGTLRFALSGGSTMTFNNNGLVTLSQGFLSLLAGGSHTGNFSLAASTTLTLAGSHSFSTTSHVTGSGDLVISSGANTFGASVNVNNLTINGGGNTFNAPVTVTNNTIVNNGTTDFNSTFSSGNFTINAGTATFSGNSTISNLVSFNGGTTTINSTFNATSFSIDTSLATLNITPAAAVNLGQNLTLLRGSLNISGANTTVTGVLSIGNNGSPTSGNGAGTLSISSGSLFANTVIAGSTAGGSGTLAISGTANVTIGGGMKSSTTTVSGGNVTVLTSPPPPSEDPELNFAIVAGYQTDGSLALSGGSITTPRLKLGITAGKTGNYSQTGGNLTISDTFAIGNDAALNSGAGIGIASITAGSLTANTILISSTAGGLGSLTVSSGATIRTNSLLFAQSAPGIFLGSLDLTNGKIVVEDLANHTATLAALRAAVTYGRTHNAGILSSTLFPNQTAVAIDNAVAQLTTFGGQPVDAGSILLTVDSIGDTNGDQKVDITDLNIVASHWQQPVPAGTNGDLNNDGKTDISDLNLLANTWQAGVGGGDPSLELSPQSSVLSTSSTPEPASLALLLFPAALFRLRNRRPKF